MVSFELKSIKGKDRKRAGRGISAGLGKTAGRGTKGQKSRAGYNLPNRFEGGQTPLALRLPKLPGFKSVHDKAIVITLDHISKKYSDGETIDQASLVKKGLLKNGQKAKILNTGKLTVSVKISSFVSASKSVAALFKKDEIKTEKPVTEEKPKKNYS